MKGIAAVSLLGLIALMTLGISMDISSVTNRESELDDTLTTSMRNTLKASNINKMYVITEAELSAELMRNIAENINTDAAVDVYIMDSSLDGLLDVNLSASFDHLNGIHDTKSIRKTLLVEKTPSE